MRISRSFLVRCFRPSVFIAALAIVPATAVGISAIERSRHDDASVVMKDDIPTTNTIDAPLSRAVALLAESAFSSAPSSTSAPAVASMLSATSTTQPAGEEMSPTTTGRSEDWSPETAPATPEVPQPAPIIEEAPTTTPTTPAPPPRATRGSLNGLLISQGNQLTSDPWTVVALQPDGTGAQTLTPGLQPNWQSGHAKFAFTTTDGMAWIANGDGSERRALPTPPGAHWEQASLSPDGSRVVGPCGTAALCLTPVDGAATRVINFMPYFLYPKTTTWSPDGHRVAFQYDDVGYPTNIAVINVDDAAPWPQDLPLNQTKSWSDGAYRSPAWSPDGTSIAFVRTVDQITTRQSTVEVLDLASGTVKVWAALNGEPSDLYGSVKFHSVAWSPDGYALVAVREGMDDLVIIHQDGTRFNVPGIHGARSVSWF